MKKKKIILKILAVLVMILSITFFIGDFGDKSNADAGYHSSYSGGSSSSSSSSSHSSSSSSSSSRRSSSSSSSRSSYSSGSSGNISGSELVGIIIFIIIIIIISLATRNGSKHIETSFNSKPTYSNIRIANNQNAINEIKKYLPQFNTNEFLTNGYNVFVRIEEAWMNFDLEKVRDCITDEMLNMYESQLTSMEMKGEQNIMKGFKLLNSAITEAKKQNNILEIKTKYDVEFYDYIIDKNTNKVVRGDSNRKIRMLYEFTFIKDIENVKLDKCPNCGASINMNSAGICEYCNSKLVDDSKNWVMSKKISLSQQ